MSGHAAELDANSQPYLRERTEFRILSSSQSLVCPECHPMPRAGRTELKH
jgi:hypothetical protein